MNRMNFEEPRLELCRFAVWDVITTSNLTDGGAGDNPDSGSFGEIFG